MQAINPLKFEIQNSQIGLKSSKQQMGCWKMQAHTPVSLSLRIPDSTKSPQIHRIIEHLKISSLP
jgi:hypothetical protein